MGKEMKVVLPEIEDEITTAWAVNLCRHFGLEHLCKRIDLAPLNYKPWKFDGCSCLPDRIMGLFTGCDWQDITYKCCLPHDLGYAYGEPGNDLERKRVDLKFYRDLMTKAGMNKWCAAAFLAAVRMGGAETFGLSFSWGFARIKNSEVTGDGK